MVEVNNLDGLRMKKKESQANLIFRKHWKTSSLITVALENFRNKSHCGAQLTQSVPITASLTQSKHPLRSTWTAASSPTKEAGQLNQTPPDYRFQFGLV